jgi:hypothetical protein
MMPGENEDPLLRMLSELPLPSPRQDRADHVRTLCHEAFARRRRRDALRRRAIALGDAACFVLLGVYLSSVVSEALRLIAAGFGPL